MKDITFSIPRDYRLFNCYTRLKTLLKHDDQMTTYAVVMLYQQLAIQATMYGHVGFFKESEVEAFLLTVVIEAEYRHSLMQHFEKAGYLTRHEVFGVKGWFCESFHDNNFRLDKDYTEVTGPVITNVGKLMKAAAEATLNLYQRIPRDCWLDLEGKQIDSTKMNEALLFIRTVDGIMQRSPRKEDQFTPSVIQSAVQIVTKFSQPKLLAIFRVWYPKARSESRSIKLPRTTEQALEKFDDLVFLLMPAEGWELWGRG